MMASPLRTGIPYNLDSLEQLVAKYKWPEEQVCVQLIKIDHSLAENEIELKEANQRYEDLLDKVKQMGQAEYLEAVVAFRHGNAFQHFKLTSRAIAKMQLAYKKANKFNLEAQWFAGEMNYLLGSIYCTIRIYDKATGYLLKSVTYEDLNPNIAIDARNALGIIYMDQRQHEAAVFQFKQAMLLADAYQMPVWTGIIETNLARLFIKQKDYVQARKLLISARTRIRENRDSLFVHDNLLKNATLLAQLYLLTKSDSALPTLRAVAKLVPTSEDYAKVKDYHATLARVLTSQGKHAQAGLAYEDAIRSGQKEYDQLYTQKVRTNLIGMRSITALEEAKLAKERDRASYYQQLFIVTVLGILLLVAAISLYVLLRKRQSLLAKQESELQRIQAQKQEARAKQEKTQQELKLLITKFEEKEESTGANDRNRSPSDLTYSQKQQLMNKLELKPLNSTEMMFKRMEQSGVLNSSQLVAYREQFDNEFKRLQEELAPQVPNLTILDLKLLTLNAMGFGQVHAMLALGISSHKLEEMQLRISQKLPKQEVEDSIVETPYNN